MTNINDFKNPDKDSQPIPADSIEALLDMQTELLAEAACSDDHSELLDSLCLLAEKLVPESTASVMTLNPEDDKLYIRAAPSLPREAAIAINGIELGEGSCGNAVLHDQEMYVSNTSEDKRWENIREFAEFFKINACWSIPIHDAQHQAMGSFSLSSFDNRIPDNFQRKLLNLCATMAGIIFEREQHIKDLKHLADFDALTNLMNRRKFSEDAELLLRQVKRSEGKMALIFIDIDNFKWINDDYGHEAGDEVLKVVAKSLQQQCRDNELVCRWGGDEFILAIVCKGDCQVDVRAVVKRNLRIFGKPIETGTNDVIAKMSCGVAVYPSDATDFGSLVNCADQAMLNAKSTGRNKMSYYQSIKQA